MKNKFYVINLIILSIIMLSNFNGINNVYAIDGNVDEVYIIYDENNNYLFEKSQVEVGDFYINKKYQKYEIIAINKETKTGTAKFLRQIKKPKVKISPAPSPITTTNREIGLYCTHNDESYLPSDGYYSIYGKGSVHQVAGKLKTEFQNMGVNVYFDETLHLPHDTSAYTRSKVTAKKLLDDNNLNALFDIHRDAGDKSFYTATVNGVNYSKVRIVIGNANADKAINEDFAVYLMAVADEMYPWLFADIFYGHGHYNQDLFEKSLLFEMGTHLIEKELVLNSVPALADVINTALFNTTVDNSTGDLSIGGTATDTNPTIDEALSNKSTQNNYLKWNLIIYFSELFIVIALLTRLTLLVYKTFIKNHLKY